MSSSDKQGNETKEPVEEVTEAETDDWFVGTWSVYERASGFATKIEIVDENTVALTRMDISHVDEGSVMTKCRAYYATYLQRDSSGDFVIVGHGNDVDGNKKWSTFKIYKPEDGSNSVEIVLAPREVEGTDKYEDTQTWYRSD